MKKTLLVAVSALALMATSPMAFAQDQAAQASAETNTVTKAEVKQNWEKTKTSVSNTADKVSDATKKAYENVKASLITEDEDVRPFEFNTRIAASGMIGQPVYNHNNERVAQINDIILDANGNAATVVLSDAGFFKMGKLVAFDYGLVSQRSKDGDVIMPLTEETIDKAKNFEYGAKEADADTLVPAADSVSVAKLLDGELLDTNRKKVAKIDNITFRDGKADELIVVFDQTLGMGGEKAALEYEDLTLVRDGGDYDVQLSTKQSVRFDSYKKTVTN
jgi:sporulation protein YlmC with PRC-barrel domain